MNREKYDRAKWVPIIITGLILIAIYFAFSNLSVISREISRFISIISPLLYGILFTYFLYVPQRTIEKLLKKVKIKKFTVISDRARGIGTIIVFLLLIALIALASAFLIPAVASSITDLVNNIPGYIQEIVRYFDSMPENSLIAELNISSMLRENTGNIINMLLNSQGIEQAARGVASFAGGVFNVIMGIFLALYLLVYRNEIGEYFTRLGSAVFKRERSHERVTRYMRRINEVLLTFIASKGVDALCNFTAATLITTIFGVPYSALLGLMAGLFNFIPYIGSLVSSIIISLLAFLTCEIPIAIAVTACIIGFQQLDGNVIEPRIMKTSLKVNPILVIMAVVIGGAYFGMAGMFLGVPIAVIIKQILEEYMTSREAVPDEDDIRR